MKLVVSAVRAAGRAGVRAAVGIGVGAARRAPMTAAAARSMSSRRASISRSRSTASSMKRCGRRRRCSRGSRATRRSTARRPTTPPTCSCGIRRRRCTSASAPRRRPASVRATLADRDRIQSDDHVIIFLSTYNDGRQAMVFGVNPLGVQLDGALAEGTRGIGRRLQRLSTGRETPDLSPDFVFQSKGRVTDAATKSRCAFRSRACAISRSRSRTGASTSRASCRSRASKTAGRRPSAMRRRSSRSRDA